MKRETNVIRDRRTQIQAFIREITLKHPQVRGALLADIRELARDCAMVGAAEERSRALSLIKTDSVARHLIVQDPVMKVLGFKD